MSVEAPSASEAVQRRLAELFAQIQEPTTSTQPVEQVDFATEDSADDWLSRLRPAAEVVEPDQPVAEPTPQLRQIANQAAAFTREHLATVVVVLLVAVAWTAYSLFQARSTAVATPTPSSAAPSVVAPSAAGSPQPSATDAKTIRVHVIGAVRRPGVVQLGAGARITDAIAAAGGLTADAAAGEVNLAQLAVDGSQLKIGTKKHPGGWIRCGAAGGQSDPAGPSDSPGGGADASKVSINAATVQQLDTLPGIGPVTAQKIVDWRKAHGRFSAVTELQEVDGIGPKTYADLADRIRL